MNTKKHKEEDISKIQRRREGAEWHRKRENRAQILNFDFAQIEDEPGTDLEKQTVKMLAKAPSPQDILIDEERTAVLLKVLPKVPLTPKERLAVEMTFEGLEPVDINRKLGLDVRDTMVTKALARGKKKLIRFLRAADYLKYQKD